MRTLILEGIKETHTLERYSLIGVAAFWTWIFSQSEWREWMRWARFLPSVLVILAVLRSGALLLFILKIAKYVYSVEPHYGLGWEHFIKRQKIPTMTIVATIFWVSLFVACTAIGWAFDGSWLAHAPKRQ